MPWCPKCNLRFRNGAETCSECGARLVDSLPLNRGVSPTTVLELAAVVFVAPLIGFALWVVPALVWPQALSLLASCVVLAMAVLYGYCRRIRAGVLTWILAYALGGLLVAIATVVLGLSMPEPFGLVLIIPYFWFCSTVLFLAVLLGSLIRYFSSRKCIEP